jgi:hypothetical protein
MQLTFAEVIVAGLLAFALGALIARYSRTPSRRALLALSMALVIAVGIGFDPVASVFNAGFLAIGFLLKRRGRILPRLSRPRLKFWRRRSRVSQSIGQHQAVAGTMHPIPSVQGIRSDKGQHDRVGRRLDEMRAIRKGLHRISKR